MLLLPQLQYHCYLTGDFESCDDGGYLNGGGGHQWNLGLALTADDAQGYDYCDVFGNESWMRTGDDDGAACLSS